MVQSSECEILAKFKLLTPVLFGLLAIVESNRLSEIDQGFVGTGLGTKFNNSIYRSLIEHTDVE